MGMKVNVDEIFEIAERIESNGAIFYKKAAQKAVNSKIKQMFLDMADMEQGHYEIFKKMHSLFSSKESASIIFDPDSEATKYIQLIADSHSSEGKHKGQEFTGKETPRQILETAINAEKDSILYYQSLKSLITDESLQEKIDAVIMEEVSHVTNLQEQLENLEI